MFTCIVLCGMFVIAEENLFKNNKWKASCYKIMEESGCKQKIKDNKLIADIPEIDTSRPWLVGFRQNIKPEAGVKYILSFIIDTPCAGYVHASYSAKKNLGFWEKVYVTPGKSFQYLFFIPPSVDSNLKTKMILFIGDLHGKVTISDMKLIKLDKSNILPFAMAKSWKVFTNPVVPESFSSIPESMKTQEAKVIFPKTVSLKNNGIDLAALAGKNKGVAVLYNKFSSDKDGFMYIGASADWRFEAYMNGTKIYSTIKQGNGSGAFSPNDHIFCVPVKAGSNLFVAKVLNGSKGWLFVCGKPLITEFEKSKDWMPVDISSVQVKKGSVLDLSYLSDTPAGKYGRVIVGNDGGLAFENKPSTAIRFKGFNGLDPALRNLLWHGSDSEFKRNAVLFAAAVHRQGYNLLRLNGPEGLICRYAPKDMSVNLKHLDRLDFLVSELKKKGIYIHFTIFSYSLFTSKAANSKTHQQRDKHKLMLYLDGEWEREHFRYGAEVLLNHVNPYTGLAWKNDPCIALVEFYNEQYAGIARFNKFKTESPDVYARLLSKWQEWLKNKFKDSSNQKLQKKLLTNIPIPNMYNKKSLFANEFSLFCMDLVKKTTLWCMKIVRETGYKGLVTQNGRRKLLYIAAGWETLPLIDNHSYYCHPYAGRNGKGAKVVQASSIFKKADYLRGINGSRLIGRPFGIGEFGHAFWNQWQHEGGLVYGAYSAFQGFDSISIHASPVLLSTRNYSILKNFRTGNSPVVRANEFLAACLFTRGDVRTSPHMVSLAITKAYLDSNCNSSNAISSEQNKIFLLSGFALSFPNLKLPAGTSIGRKPDITILPSGGAKILYNDWFENVIETKDKKFSLDFIIAEMKKKGILAKSNISNPSKGIFQSDTGEIIMRSHEKMMKVITPKTEAVSLVANKSESMKYFRINNSSTPACIAVCSVDNKPLASSKRIILIYNTEVANSGMQLSGDRKTMIDLGTSPILMKTGKLDATLKWHIGKNVSLYAIALDGSRREKLPLKIIDNTLQINIDTSTLKNGPTPFFELVKE